MDNSRKDELLNNYDYVSLENEGYFTAEQIKKAQDRAWSKINKYLGHEDDGRQALRKNYIVQDTKNIVN